MYSRLVDYFVYRFFEEKVKSIQLKEDGGYKGLDTCDLPELELGDVTIVTGEGSIIPEDYFIGKSSFIVDVATLKEAHTIVDLDPIKALTENKDFIEAKSGATLGTEVDGRTLIDAKLYNVVKEKPEADTVIYCYKHVNMHPSRQIDIVDWYIRLVEIYGFDKVIPVCLYMGDEGKAS